MTAMKKAVCLLLAVFTSLSLFGCKRTEDTEASELLIFAETTAQLVEDTKPTVEADGNTDKKADADPKTESVHTYQWISSVVSSICTAQGYTLRTCLVCR